MVLFKNTSTFSVNSARRLQASYQDEISSVQHHSVQIEFDEPVNDRYNSQPSSSFLELQPSAPGETASTQDMVFGQFLTVDTAQGGQRQSQDSFYDAEEGEEIETVFSSKHTRSPSLSNALDRVRESIAGVSSHFECPVCFEEMKPPLNMFQCRQGHVVCQVIIRKLFCRFL